MKRGGANAQPTACWSSQWSERSIQVGVSHMYATLFRPAVLGIFFFFFIVFGGKAACKFGSAPTLGYAVPVARQLHVYEVLRRMVVVGAQVRPDLDVPVAHLIRFILNL